MARNRSGFYNTIEYIGPRPQKPKPRPTNVFGGWVILVIAGGAAFWFGKPLVQSLRAAENGASTEQVNIVISALSSSKDGGDRLAAAALAHSREQVTFDSAYYKIDFPGGDIPADKGKAEDVIVRCYRRIGIDLQQKVNEDMSGDFRVYPQIWGATAPDPNIDHRRAQNLQRFFSRHGETLGTSRNTSEYKPGDVVVWSLSKDRTHIGIVVPSPSGRDGEPWIVHNIGEGVKWESGLFDHQIIGHFRYSPYSHSTASAEHPAQKEAPETF